DHYVRELLQKPYVYAGHIVPHDAQAKELGTGKSRLEVLEQLGLKTITLAPMHRIEDGINAVRVFLPKCWFDAGNAQVEQMHGSTSWRLTESLRAASRGFGALRSPGRRQ